MLYKIGLKNSKKTVLVNDFTYEYITTNPYMLQLKLSENLREHSNGYAVFQKSWPQKSGKYKTETIYLHKLVAEKFIAKPDNEQKLVVIIKNGNPLDCRVENLEWAPLHIAARNTKKTENKLGYRGVSKEKNKYRAVIYKGKQRYELGFFNTPEEAAVAYNNKSIELFGKTRSLNRIRSEVNAQLDTTVPVAESGPEVFSPVAGGTGKNN
jgi:hypothetical protein